MLTPEERAALVVDDARAVITVTGEPIILCQFVRYDLISRIADAIKAAVREERDRWARDNMALRARQALFARE